MMMILRAPLTGFVILLMTACAKPAMQNNHYFLPSPQPVAESQNHQATQLLQLSEVQLADFLDKDGLVLQLDDITLNQAKNHLWAEDLRRQINRGLRERLNQQQHSYTVVGPSTPADLHLSLEIHAFHGRYDGVALTSGEWQLKNNQGDIQDLKHFAFQTELSESGYPALVRALGENLDKLAVQLAEALARMP